LNRNERVDMNENETFGQQVFRLREERGWTQKRLAEESGVPVRTIQDIEKDLRDKPQRATLLKLRRALDLEGDAVRERSEWPDDVAAIVDIVGAYMMTLTPAERVRWIAAFVRGEGQTLSRRPRESHPSGG
jgi:transcriptional regulator with XRE-family HTH domain